MIQRLREYPPERIDTRSLRNIEPILADMLATIAGYYQREQGSTFALGCLFEAFEFDRLAAEIYHTRVVNELARR
jgi:hypothetical protein